MHGCHNKNLPHCSQFSLVYPLTMFSCAIGRSYTNLQLPIFDIQSASTPSTSTTHKTIIKRMYTLHINTHTYIHTYCNRQDQHNRFVVVQITPLNRHTLTYTFSIHNTQHCTPQMFQRVFHDFRTK